MRRVALIVPLGALTARPAGTVVSAEGRNHVMRRLAMLAAVLAAAALGVAVAACSSPSSSASSSPPASPAPAQTATGNGPCTTTISNQTVGDVFVPAGQTCTLSNVTVRGNITDYGTLQLTTSAAIGGNVVAEPGSILNEVFPARPMRSLGMQ